MSAGVIFDILNEPDSRSLAWGPSGNYLNGKGMEYWYHQVMSVGYSINPSALSSTLSFMRIFQSFSYLLPELCSSCVSQAGIEVMFLPSCNPMILPFTSPTFSAQMELFPNSALVFSELYSYRKGDGSCAHIHPRTLLRGITEYSNVSIQRRQHPLPPPRR